MINEKIKQLKLSNKNNLQQNILSNIFNLNSNEKPYRIIVSATPGTWFYVNNDISPIIIDETGFLDWDLSGFGTFDSLYFSTNLNCFIYDELSKRWVKTDDGYSYKELWKNYFNYFFNEIEHDEIFYEVLIKILIVKLYFLLEKKEYLSRNDLLEELNILQDYLFPKQQLKNNFLTQQFILENNQFISFIDQFINDLKANQVLIEDLIAQDILVTIFYYEKS